MFVCRIGQEINRGPVTVTTIGLIADTKDTLLTKPAETRCH